jgi:hypothetical protein
LKPEWRGSTLAQEEKYQGKNYDKRIMMMIIIITIIIK